MTNTDKIRRVFAVCTLSALLGACVAPAKSPGRLTAAQTAGDGPGSIALAVRGSAEQPRNLPKSKRGNAATYEVFGRQYRVMDSAAGFTERGVASWYGAKFHGRETSSGEVYDMHAITAAHKHLPLPTFVRVNNLDNGRSIVVKVNDRGPFVGDRIIDVSYAAALQLDMVDTGTARVSIEAVSTHQQLNTQQQPGVAAIANNVNAKAIARYIQLGSFRSEANAVTLFSHMNERMPQPVRIDHDIDRALYRVQIGPLANEAVISEVKALLAQAGVNGYTMITTAY